MNVRVDDLEALRSIRPLDIAAYLRARGWSEVDPSGDDPLSAWETTIGDTTFDVLAPRHQGWRDYGRRVRSVLETLGEAEQRSQLAIVNDITAVFVDVVRLRAMNGSSSDDTIALLDGLGIAAAGRGLMLSAACSAFRPQKAYPARKPAVATKYLEGLRLGQSERGSYVLTVLSPVSPFLMSSQLRFDYAEDFEAIPDPYERQVTLTLSSALYRIHHAAARGAATGALDAFEEAVPFGVSADLCEALDLVRECSRVSSFELSIAWAPSRSVPPGTPSSTTFTHDVLEVVHEAGRMLRERTPVEDFELEGPVIDLRRPDATLHGTAIVFGRVNGQPRQISVELWNSDWNTANEALSGHRIFRCSGS